MLHCSEFVYKLHAAITGGPVNTSYDFVFRERLVPS